MSMSNWILDIRIFIIIKIKVVNSPCLFVVKEMKKLKEKLKTLETKTESENVDDEYEVVSLSVD